MPAYRLPIHQECDRLGCAKKATHRVLNGQNALIGRYCAVHSIARVRELNR